MRKAFFILGCSMMLGAAQAQQLTVKWEELTAGDFLKAIQTAQNTCVLPIGILEKHGPHLPLGSDLINVRWATLHGAEQEYASSSRNTISARFSKPRASPEQLPKCEAATELLQETTDEMARNGWQENSDHQRPWRE
jgi:creatinine amidohydrolase